MISDGTPVEALISIGYDKEQIEQYYLKSYNSALGIIDALVAMGIERVEATIVLCAFTVVGCEGVIDVEKGIYGHGYSIEKKDYSHVANRYTYDTGLKEMKRLRQLILDTPNDIDKEKLARSIAEIVDAVVAIKVDYYTQDEFITKKNYLIRAIGLSKKIILSKRNQ